MPICFVDSEPPTDQHSLIFTFHNTFNNDLHNLVVDYILYYASESGGVKSGVKSTILAPDSCSRSIKWHKMLITKESTSSSKIYLYKKYKSKK